MGGNVERGECSYARAGRGLFLLLGIPSPAKPRTETLMDKTRGKVISSSCYVVWRSQSLAEMGAPEGHLGFKFLFSAFLFLAHGLYTQGYLTVLNVG